MARIFLPLSFLSTASLLVAMVLGLMIDDPKIATAAVQAGVQYHFLAALAALVFATLVHAIVFTYFMGTGRWIEETSSAYQLANGFYERSQKIKYRVLPMMVLSFLILLLTGALGAASDPASPMQAKTLATLPISTAHLYAAFAMIATNLFVNWLEFQALEKNGQIIDEVLVEVRRIRLEKGLAVDG